MIHKYVKKDSIHSIEITNVNRYISVVYKPERTVVEWVWPFLSFPKKITKTLKAGYYSSDDEYMSYLFDNGNYSYNMFIKDNIIYKKAMVRIAYNDNSGSDFVYFESDIDAENLVSDIIDDGNLDLVKIYSDAS
jgi:hypothetical protein